MRRSLLYCAFAGAVLSACGKAPHQPTQASAADTDPLTRIQPVPAASPPSQLKDLSHRISAATSIPVELRTVIDPPSNRARFYEGVVSADVSGSDGRLAIPAGSAATIIVRKMAREGPISSLVLGLYTVHIQGQQYSLSNGQTDAATLSFREDAGQGPAHGSIHLSYGTILPFKPDKPVELR